MTNNDDFFAALEQQLVVATTERTTRLRRARMRRAGLLSTILVAVLAAGGGLAAAVTSTDSSNNTGRPAATTMPATQVHTAPSPAATATPQPGTYIVSVLNATTTPGLARGVATRLQNMKFKIGTVTNAATHDRARTRVEYAPGHRAEADDVARAIDVGSGAIVPESSRSKTVAGNRSTVVVLVGADQNTSPRAK